MNIVEHCGLNEQQFDMTERLAESSLLAAVDLLSHRCAVWHGKMPQRVDLYIAPCHAAMAWVLLAYPKTLQFFELLRRNVLGGIVVCTDVRGRPPNCAWGVYSPDLDMWIVSNGATPAPAVEPDITYSARENKTLGGE